MSEILSLKQILNLINYAIEDVSNHSEVYYSKKLYYKNIKNE